MLYTLEEHAKKALVAKEFNESLIVQGKVSESDRVKLTESAKSSSGKKLIVQMEAIHVGLTKNFTYYTEEGLKEGLSSWTQPYNKPVLTHHNQYNGEPIGRILSAEYSDKNISGKSGLVFTVEITDPVAVEKVLDGRYQTVSIGASAEKVTCNICGTNRTEEWCSHYPGETYEEQTCHFIIGPTYGREVSYVNTPSDSFAGNISVEVANKEAGQTESVDPTIYQMSEGSFYNVKDPDINLYESLNSEVKEIFNLMMSGKGKGEGQVDNNMEEEQAAKQEQGSVQETVKDDSQGAASAEPQAQVNVEEGSSMLQDLVNNLTKENLRLNSALEEKDNALDSLTQENQRLISEAHNMLAEKVVDLKFQLGKGETVGASREDVMSSHISRTSESLRDTLSDLEADLKSTQTVERGSVTNPGITVQEDDGEKADKMSLEEGVKLISSMFGRAK